MLGHDQILHFRVFGFVVLRGVLDPTEVAALGSEVRGAFGSGAGEYLPLTVDRAPVSQSLIADDPRLFQGAADLLGTLVVPTPPIATRVTGDGYWHTNVGPDVPGVTFLVPLSPGGALRVIPGSHDPGFAVRLRSYLGADPGGQGYRPWPVPHVAPEAEPGDVIALDVHVFHASTGDGRPSWRIEYLEWPGIDNPRRLRLVSDLVIDTGEFDHEDYSGQSWPTWREWASATTMSPSRAIAVERLGLLGALRDD